MYVSTCTFFYLIIQINDMLKIVLLVGYVSQIPSLCVCGAGGVQVVSAIPNHLDGRSAPGQVPTGSVCYERNGV